MKSFFLKSDLSKVLLLHIQKSVSFLVTGAFFIFTDHMSDVIRYRVCCLSFSSGQLASSRDVSCWISTLWSNEDPAGLGLVHSVLLLRTGTSSSFRAGRRITDALWPGFLTPGPGFIMSRTADRRVQPGGSHTWGGHGEPERWNPTHVHPEPAAGLRVSAVLQSQLDVSTSCVHHQPGSIRETTDLRRHAATAHDVIKIMTSSRLSALKHAEKFLQFVLRPPDGNWSDLKRSSLTHLPVEKHQRQIPFKKGRFKDSLCGEHTWFKSNSGFYSNQAFRIQSESSGMIIWWSSSLWSQTPFKKLNLRCLCVST